jgi:fatty-acyl-CoA synthase
LGTKWAPTYIRVVDALPVTGTGKLDRKALRADGWRAADPVWWRPGPAVEYRCMTGDDVDGLQAEFDRWGRRHLLS